MLIGLSVFAGFAAAVVKSFVSPAKPKPKPARGRR